MINREVQQLLDTQTKTVSGLPTVFTENQPSNQKSGTSWARTTLLPARTSIASIGLYGQQLYSGLYQVDVFFPKDRGFLNSSNMADAIIGVFQPSTILAGSTFNVLIMTSWRLPANTYETFYNIPVQIEWNIYK